MVILRYIYYGENMIQDQVYTNHVMFSYWRVINGGATRSMVEDYLLYRWSAITLSGL